MRKNINNVVFLAALFLISACEKRLDLFPETQVSDGSFWNTTKDFELAANALYFSLPSRRLDINSDIIYGINVNAVSSGTILPTETDNTWNNAYSRIREATNLIQQADARPHINTSRYKAEAHFFRAFWYFELVSTFGDVPLIKSVLTTESEELNLPRTPREHVIDFIIEDLQFAVANLPERGKLNGAAELGRITKGAANAFLGRVALFEGTWSKYNGGSKVNERLQIARDAANAVINSNEYELYDDHGDDSYRQLFFNQAADDNSLAVKPEHILARRYWIDISIHNFSNAVSQGASYSPTKKIVDMYLSKDGLPIDKSPLFQGYEGFKSEFENRDLRMINSIAKVGDILWTNNGPAAVPAHANHFQNTKTGYRIWKTNGEGADRAPNREYNDHEIICYAEVLLVYAEATFELNGEITDAELDKSINLLRNRGKIAPLSNALVDNNGLDMLTEIRRERTIELAFEGHRLNDLRRWGIAVAELKKPLKGIQYENSEWKNVVNLPSITAHGTDNDGFVIVQPESTRFFSEKNILFPLPLQELQLNTNLSQNPGW